MQQKLFWIWFGIVLLVSLFLRLYLVRDNNFYFTMDQGHDAVGTREIWYRQQLPLMGPPTSIKGFYDGALWYYFLTPGYLLFAGHPFGAVFMVIILNVALTAFVIVKLKSTFSSHTALLVGLSLQFFWPFFETSRYAFNPFLLVACAFLTIFFLLDAWEGKTAKFILSGVPVALPLHSELASFPPLFGLYFLLGIWGVIKKKWSVTTLILGLAVVGLFFLPHLYSELTTGFAQYHAVQTEFASGDGIFSQHNLVFFTNKMLEFLGKNLIRQSMTLGTILLFIVIVSYLVFDQIQMHKSLVKASKQQIFVHRFAVLTALLLLLSWIWFSSNKGWSAWHTVYVPPLIFLASLLMLLRLPRRLALVLFVSVMLSQLHRFYIRYSEYSQPSSDASILKNELAAVDWVYGQAQDQGFYVYSYLPSVEDYPYQYLFWWHGRSQYGYVPCEYSTYPGIPDFFVPGVNHYQEPKRECTNLRFLIVEPDKNETVRNQWLENVRKDTTLLQETQIGTIKLEKRQIIQSR